MTRTRYSAKLNTVCRTGPIHNILGVYELLLLGVMVTAQCNLLYRRFAPFYVRKHNLRTLYLFWCVLWA